jgi:hypothetical protein
MAGPAICHDAPTEPAGERFEAGAPNSSTAKRRISGLLIEKRRFRRRLLGRVTLDFSVEVALRHQVGLILIGKLGLDALRSGE